MIRSSFLFSRGGLPTVALLCFMAVVKAQGAPEGQAMQANISVCMACHNADLDPPLAPPFYAVQNRYKKAYPEREAFVRAIVDWVRQPSEQKALMRRPLKKLGLMPAMDLPQSTLEAIAGQLWEQSFDPPCTHWANELANAPANGARPASPHRKSHGMRRGRKAGQQAGQDGHLAMVRMKYNQLCR